MSNDIPRSWHPYFERRGIPVSYRGLAARSGMSHEAVRRVIRGWSVKPASLRQIAEALGVDVEVVQELRGDAPDLTTPWEPPVASSFLSHDEREALSRLISLMTMNRAEEREGSGQQPATTSQPAIAPASLRVSPRELAQMEVPVLYLHLATLGPGPDRAAVIAELDHRRLPLVPSREHAVVVEGVMRDDQAKGQELTESLEGAFPETSVTPDDVALAARTGPNRGKAARAAQDAAAEAPDQ